VTPAKERTFLGRGPKKSIPPCLFIRPQWRTKEVDPPPRVFASAPIAERLTKKIPSTPAGLVPKLLLGNAPSAKLPLRLRSPGKQSARHADHATRSGASRNCVSKQERGNEKKSPQISWRILLKSLPRLILQRKKCRFQLEVTGHFLVCCGCADFFAACDFRAATYPCFETPTSFDSRGPAHAAQPRARNRRVTGRSAKQVRQTGTLRQECPRLKNAGPLSSRRRPQAKSSAGSPSRRSPNGIFIERRASCQLAIRPRRIGATNPPPLAPRYGASSCVRHPVSQRNLSVSSRRIARGPRRSGRRNRTRENSLLS
jgi:hypothetical protein